MHFPEALERPGLRFTKHDGDNCGRAAREEALAALIGFAKQSQLAFESAGIRFLDNEPGGGIGVRVIAAKPRVLLLER